MPNELKPCPFCGGRADLITHSFWNEKKQAHTDKTYSIKCFICLTESYLFYETEQIAIEAWNRRADNA
jgi:Lar family restriction alleviation protein